MTFAIIQSSFSDAGDESAA
jgi:BRCT domain, a BRCA1 C-terminus domain